MTVRPLEAHLSPDELAIWAGLTTPRKIQDFLDTIAYEPEYANRCPLRVLRERRGHCFDGALFAAAALRRLGYPPFIVNLFPEPLTDDEHMLAVYRRHGSYGAVAKSNFVGLRFREPVYRSLRELVMSYFEDYFNAIGQKTLRAYSVPLNLAAFDALNWEVEDAGADAIEKRTETLRRYPLLTPEMVRELSPVDRRQLEAGLLGSDPDGLYKVGIA
ncbi:MAG: hypothetical protein N2204_07360 [Anaerolineae bacterium]|nr:hypothetical protein [Anaerolineae bacterium]